MRLITVHNLSQVSIEASNALKCIKEAEREATDLFSQFAYHSMNERYDLWTPLIESILGVHRKLENAQDYLLLSALSLLKAHQAESDEVPKVV